MRKTTRTATTSHIRTRPISKPAVGVATDTLVPMIA
jgi:hypothetical protein